MEVSKNEKRTSKDYLDKTFLEELNYKIWSTKGARFNANKRLINISRLSNLSTSMLSIYLIAVGLLSVYNIYSSNVINENLIAYSITCLSIVLLIFVQIENAKQFDLRAKEFHNCGLELSVLYNKLRIFKTLKTNPTKYNRQIFATETSEEYQRILERYENHNSIDHQIFKTTNPDYHELEWYYVLMIKIGYYFRTAFIYHLLIIIPPVIIIGLILNNTK
ncbi:MAG: SLATT domain-containing protein [Bacteroidota bacterium]